MASCRCFRHVVCWILLFMLYVLFQPSASEQFMEDLCGATIQAESSGGVLHSQRGTHYRDDVDCTLTITADPDRNILLSFLLLETEGVAPRCSTDYLHVYDGAGELWTFCGELTGNVTLSRTNDIYLELHTDGSVVYRGFKLAYSSFKIAEQGSCDLGEFLCDSSRCIDSSLIDDYYNHCGDYSDEPHTFKTMDELCGQTITAGKYAGLLHSQSTERYSNNFDCTVTIVVDYGRRILLRFEYLGIEGDGNGIGCLNRDALLVYDGAAAGTQNRTVFCGSSAAAADITTSGRSATLRFKTDSSVVYRGFVILYTSIRTPGNSGCWAPEFRCSNNRCISANLTYDSFDNCGDNSDEQHFSETVGGDDGFTEIVTESSITLTIWGIVAIIIGCIVGLAVLVVCGVLICVLACRRGNRPAHQQQHAYTAVTAPPQQVGAPPAVYNQQPPLAMQTTGPAAPYPQPDGQPLMTYPQQNPEPSPEQPTPPEETKS